MAGKRNEKPEAVAGELVPSGNRGGPPAPPDDGDSDYMAVIQPGGLAAIAKSECESQLDAAHKYPRKIAQAMAEATAMVERSPEVAAMCYYTLPRAGKDIMGPSVRLAEIMASAWGNLHVGARPIDVGETDVTCQGVAWDLQKNVRVTVEKKRRITDKNGKRFNEDMIVMTQNACSSIVLRDAIFRVIPRAYVQELFDTSRMVAVGAIKAIGERRLKVVARLVELGATEARILAKLGRPDVEQITAEDLEKLLGFGTAIKERLTTADKAFPPLPQETPTPEKPTEGQRMKLGDIGPSEPAKAAPAPAPDAGSEG